MKAKIRFLVLAFIIYYFSTLNSYSQAIQAIKNIDVELEQIDDGVADNTEGALILVSQKLGAYRQFLDYNTLHPLTPDPYSKQVINQIQTVIQKAEKVLEVRDNSKFFADSFKEFNEAENVLIRLNNNTSILDKNLASQSVVLGTTVPGVHTLVPDIAFTLGAEYNKDVWSLGVGTNLLGAVAGSAFGALGSETLKNYFTNNVSIGTTIPMSSNGNLSAQLGLGLGTINLKKATIWPVIHIEQLDGEDSRIPIQISSDNIDENNWSTSIISFAILPFNYDQISTRLQQGKLIPIPIIGIRTPFYYPGNSFSALGALFTDNRSDYKRGGKVQLILGVSFPLLKIKPPTGTQE